MPPQMATRPEYQFTKQPTSYDIQRGENEYHEWNKFNDIRTVFG